jgi:hypothetical protein
MALYTPEQITKEIEGDKAHILRQTHPEDSAHEYADSAVPIYYSDIIQDWRDLPDEYSNKFSELTTELPDRIEDLMKTDLYLYYQHHYANAIQAIIDERDSAEEEVA